MSQTSGQVEISNRDFKRILEKIVSALKKDWARKTDKTLCAYWTAFKTPIEMSPYQLVAREKRLLQLNEFDEFQNTAYENAKLYKEKTKTWHDKKIATKIFEPGQKVILFNSRLKIFIGKLKFQWLGPFRVTKVSSYDHMEIMEEQSNRMFTVNGLILKHYLGGDIDRQKTTHLLT
ncbi:uncharacterized protein LOC107611445 [Arachis ipaensis]|uniref:uncharacterized protein LOC107611445 n=1 Tax=Arachis ipaensis TaxID=130454 RepID=UPI0007AF8CD1|nr:uncharacterized protein LOC107611445 [Arachis ipaensis]XP_025670510.1 uncharacterized protein LOC112770356 [Arachis hypogaea]